MSDLDIIPYPLNTGEWIACETRKQKIVLHGSYAQTSCTGGRGTAIIDHWNFHPEKRGTAYVIDRDGKIYQTFPDNHWAWHLGLKDNGALDKESIGITLCNELPVFPTGDKDGKLCFMAFDNLDQGTVYTGPTYESHWRGESFWATPSLPQSQSVAKLIKALVGKFGLAPTCFKNSGVYTKTAWEQTTVLCHSNLSLAGLDFPTIKWLWPDLESEGLRLI